MLKSVSMLPKYPTFRDKANDTIAEALVGDKSPLAVVLTLLGAPLIILGRKRFDESDKRALTKERSLDGITQPIGSAVRMGTEALIDATNKAIQDTRVNMKQLLVDPPVNTAKGVSRTVGNILKNKRGSDDSRKKV